MNGRTSGVGGYMLFELMVAVGLLGFAVTSIAEFRLRAGKEQVWATEYSSDLASLRRALRTIEDDVRGATDAGVRDGRLELEVAGEGIGFALEENRLVRRDSAGPTVLASCFRDWSVTTARGVVHVALTLRRRRSGVGAGPTIESVIALRPRGQR